MNNHIYTTKSIILKSSNTGEANKLYFLFTEDFGLIIAVAQGIRLGKSKLKGHLQDLNISNVSLVKGKDLWRIVSAERIHKPDFLRSKIELIKNIFSLLLRLIHGEEKNTELFKTIEDFCDFLRKPEISEKNLKNLETITVLKILHALGYFKKNLGEYFADKNISEETLILFEPKRKMAVDEINLALKETHL